MTKVHYSTYRATDRVKNLTVVEKGVKFAYYYGFFNSKQCVFICGMVKDIAAVKMLYKAPLLDMSNRIFFMKQLLCRN